MISPSRCGVPARAAAAPLERLSRSQRREQLLDSAAELVAEQGFEGITVEGVAARAGVSKALPYKHFDNSADLTAALRDRELARLTQRVVGAVTPAHGLERKVAAAVHAWFEAAKERGSTLATFLRWLPEFEVAVQSRPSKETPLDWFLADVFEDELHLPRTTARVAQRVVVMGLVGALDAWTEGHASQAAIEKQTTAMVVAAVRAVAPVQK